MREYHCYINRIRVQMFRGLILILRPEKSVLLKGETLQIIVLGRNKNKG